MSFIKEGVKPTPFASNLPEASAPTTASIERQPKSKPIVSRYNVWSEDVHAAFLEAMDIYSSIGTQRITHVIESQDKNEKSTRTVKRLGRCQLVQMYILKMTGKHRTRKQVSSHIQNLKKMSKKEPNKHAFLYHDETLPLAQVFPHRELPAPSPEGIKRLHTLPPTHLSLGRTSPSSDITRYFEEQKSGAETTPESGLRCYVHNLRCSSGEHPHPKSSIFTVPPQAMPHLSIGNTMEGDSASRDPEQSLSWRGLDNKLHSLPLESEEPISVHFSQVYSSSGYCVPCRAVHRDISNFAIKGPYCSYPRSPVDHNVALDTSGFHMMDPCGYQFSPVAKLFPTPLQSSEMRRTIHESQRPFYADMHGSPPDLGSYTSPTHTTGISLAPVSDPSLSDMQSSPFSMSYVSEFILENESRYRTRRLLSSYNDYDTFTPYAQDIGLSQTQFANRRQFNHPDVCAEEQLTYPPIIRPHPRYPAAYAHTEDCIPEPPSIQL